MSARRIITVILTALSCILPGMAQQRYVSADKQFIDYLNDNGLNDDAAVLLESSCFHPSDTLSYLKGWTDYSRKRLEEASRAFSQVSRNSIYYDKSVFFNVVCNAHMGRYDQCTSLLDSYDGNYTEVKALQNAGIALLKGDDDAFAGYSRQFTHSAYQLADAENTLEKIWQDRTLGNRKSPLAAAVFSTIVPGLGKIYAGRTGEGISAFLTTGALAAMTAENWTRNGLSNWKTILSGTLGAFFYIGNIYGSYVSVSIYNNDLRKAQDTAVLYNIHIPLRSIWN